MQGTQRDTRRKSLGKRGEEIACDLLVAKGFSIIDRNVHCGHKEIDIICRDGADIRFVEVKSRRKPLEGEPWEAVNHQKQLNLGNAARRWLHSEKFKSLAMPFAECHFDVVTVVWEEKGDSFQTQYFSDAFILIYT